MAPLRETDHTNGLGPRAQHEGDADVGVRLG
jgi:hypothetical protein